MAGAPQAPLNFDPLRQTIAPRPQLAPTPKASFRTEGITMTHSAFSRSSWGMLSGMLITSCMTTPQVSRRSCSLFSFLAYTAPATSVRHAAVTISLFIVDLPGQSFSCRLRISSKSLVERGPTPARPACSKLEDARIALLPNLVVSSGFTDTSMLGCANRHVCSLEHTCRTTLAFVAMTPPQQG